MAGYLECLTALLRNGDLSLDVENGIWRDRLGWILTLSELDGIIRDAVEELRKLEEERR